MGKRKTRKPPPKKVAEKVPTSFDCPFCSNEQSVECSLNRKKSIGNLKCRICGAAYQTNITYLTDPVDVYSEWIDECDKINAGDRDEEEEDKAPYNEVHQSRIPQTQQQQQYHHQQQQQYQQQQDDEEDDDEEEEDDDYQTQQYYNQ